MSVIQMDYNIARDMVYVLKEIRDELETQNKRLEELEDRLKRIEGSLDNIYSAFP